MSQVPLAPPPRGNDNQTDRWLWLLWQRISKQGQILWSTINFSGSDIADIAARDHTDLQNLNSTDYTHLTATQATDLTDGGATSLHIHDHAAMNNLNSADYSHLTSTQLQDLTDGGATTLHIHDHNGQDGLQGGTTNEYYHVTSATFDAVDRMSWNTADGTVDIDMGFDGVTQQVGLEQYFHVKNQTGSTLTNGFVARAVGTVGNSGLILADYAIADGSHLPRYTLGVLTMDIADGEDGFVTEFGLVRGFDTTGALFGETWADGDILYLSPTTAGYLTKVEPTAPNLRVVMAMVIHAHANGSIFVRPSHGGYLHDAHDVSSATPSDGDVLTWDTATGVWQPAAIPDHNDLNGIEGGTLGGGGADAAFYSLAFENTAFQVGGGDVEAYHLSQDDYDNLTNGTPSFDSIVLSNVAGEGILLDHASPTYGWNDMLGPISIRGVGASDPSYNVYQGGIRGYQFDANEEVYIEFHILHDYAPGTDLYIHAHWSVKQTTTAGVATNAVTGGSVTWGFEVTYAKGHNQAVFATPITTTVVQNASTTQYQHMIAEVQLSAASPSASQLDSNNIEVDGLILVRCYLSANNMTVSSGSTPAPFLHMVDIHYQSTGVNTKNKAPDFYT